MPPPPYRDPTFSTLARKVTGLLYGRPQGTVQTRRGGATSCGNTKGENVLAAVGGIGIVGIIVIVLVVLAIFYFVRRS
jgi:hypothetical protein